MPSFDYAALRASYTRQRNDTSFQFSLSSFARANAKADAIKAEKWKVYTPFSTEQLQDDLEEEGVTITAPVILDASHVSGGRSTRASCASFFFHKTILKRPAEANAILRAQGRMVLPTDFIVVRQQPSGEWRYCIGCKRLREVEHFARDPRFPGGIAFRCKGCRGDVKFSWRNAGGLTVCI